MTGELSDRQRAVLGLVVKHHIDTAQPVGSKNVAELYSLSISSATVRNEMAWLEEHGYLTHPHPSAGRVPTEAGYRFFVEHLMGEARLPLAQQVMIRHQFHQSGLDLDQWAKLAAAVLAHVARGAALVMTPHSAQQCHLRRLDLISIRESLILLVLVMQEGVVAQRMLSLAQAEGQDGLTRAANKFNDLFAGLTTQQIRMRPAMFESFEQEILELVVQLMEETDKEARVEVYRDGLSHVLDEPEFADTRAGRQVVRVLEEHRLLTMLAGEVGQRGGVQVIIGGEGRWEDLSDCSVILSSYGYMPKISGLLGVLGPMRMPYARAISAVRYVSDVLSELVRSLYVGDEESEGTHQAN
jgi:heat-inducible transcriptional repressor